MTEIKIGKNIISKNSPCYIIAEIGVNHEGNIDSAKQMLKSAAEAGANAVKLQIVLADTLYPNDNRKGNDFYDLFKQAELSEAEYHEFKRYADELNVDCFASFNDRYGVDVSDNFDAPAFKVASTQLANLPMLDYLARKNKPVIISTGMSSDSDIQDAVATIEEAGNRQIAILHCVSNYPTLPDQVNMDKMLKLKQYGYPVGFSDHTINDIASIIAVSLGAKIIEKHFTFDKTRPSFDHRLSCEPSEFRNLVKSIRETELILENKKPNDRDYESYAKENYSVKLAASIDIEKGCLIEAHMITASRMKTGLKGKDWLRIKGSIAKRNIKKGEPFQLNDVE